MTEVEEERPKAILNPKCPKCGNDFEMYPCPLHGGTVIDCSVCCYILVECCPRENYCDQCWNGGTCG